MIRENRLFDELKVGDSASIKRICTANDLYIFAHASGNLNPLHQAWRQHPGAGTTRLRRTRVASLVSRSDPRPPHPIPRL